MLHAYVDEYGTPELDVSGDNVTTFYVLAAVMVEAKDKERLTGSIREIQERYFKNGEIASRRLKRSPRRWKKVFEAAQGIDCFSAYALVVDKRKVREDSGLVYKESFIKFVHRMLYERLFKFGDVVHVVADRQRGSRFMSDFSRYLHERLPIQDLFHRNTFMFGDSKEVHGLQLADLFAGGVGAILDPKKETPTDGIVEIIQRRAVLHWHPLEVLPREVMPRGGGGHDASIASLALRRTAAFLGETSRKEDPIVRDQVAALRYLVHVAQFVDSERWTSASRLIREAGLRGKTRMQLRQDVIGPLRDAEVLIASSSEGYKLPTGELDLRKFVDRTVQQVDPQLARLRRARDAVKLLTNGNVDLLDAPEREVLRRALDGF